VIGEGKTHQMQKEEIGDVFPPATGFEPTSSPVDISVFVVLSDAGCCCCCGGCCVGGGVEGLCDKAMRCIL